MLVDSISCILWKLLFQFLPIVVPTVLPFDNRPSFVLSAG